MDKITVEWANEARSIVLVTYHTNDWDWQDFVRVLAEQHVLMNHTDAPVVHAIVDVTRSSMIPKGGSLVSLTRKVQEIHPKQGVSVVVGARGIVAKILEIGQALLGSKRGMMITAPTIEAAYEIIAQKLAEANQDKA